MHVCFSFCLITINMTLRFNFLHNRINFILKHKLLPCNRQRLLQVYWKMFTYTTDGIVVENFLLYNTMCVIQFVILFLFYSFLCSYTLDVMYYIYFILFHFILFVQLYPDVMGHYVLGLYGVFNLLCFGRWNNHYFILFYFILFIQLYPDVMGNYGLRLCSVFNLLCCGRWKSQFIYIMLM